MSKLNNIIPYQQQLAQAILNFSRARDNLQSSGNDVPAYDQDFAQAVLNFSEQRNNGLMEIMVQYDQREQEYLQLLRDIQAGKVDAKRLNISPDGYELMPEAPKIERRNGARAEKEAVTA